MARKIVPTKSKSDKAKLPKKKSAATSLPRTEIAKIDSASVNSKQQYKTTLTDEKSIRTIHSLTTYLTIGVILNSVFLIVQLWATFAAELILSSISYFYLIYDMILIGALIWCINLLKQQRLLALWVFAGFIVANFINVLLLRSYERKELFNSLDIIIYIVQAAIIFEIYRLKRNDVLY
jgi:hypothetical protein